MSHCLFLLSLILFSCTISNCHGDFYSCPMVTSHTNHWNKSIINTNPYSCQSIDCSFIAALYRSKYICNEWPFYTNGLFPKRIESTYSFQCAPKQTPNILDLNSANNNGCNEWHSNKQNKNNCYCIKHNGIYCLHWYCNDNEHISIHKCNISSSYQQGFSTIYCPTYIDNSHVFSNCYCKLESHTANFCQRWYCEYYTQHRDTENFNHISLKTEQTEWQKCISLVSTTNLTKYAAYNNKLCFKWVGDVINDNEWSVNECICNIPSNNEYNAFCAEWNCTEIGMKYEVSLFWIWFVVFDIICAFVMCSYCGLASNKYRNTNNEHLKHKRKKCLIFFYVLNIIIMPLLTLFIGGFINFLFYIVTAMLSFVIGCMCTCFSKNNVGGIIDGDEFSEYEQAVKYDGNDHDEINSENEIKNMLSYSAAGNCNQRKISINGFDNNLDIKYDEDNDTVNDNDKYNENGEEEEKIDNQWIDPDGKIRASNNDFDEYDDNTTLITSTIVTTNATLNTCRPQHFE